MRPRDISKLIQAAELKPDDIALVVGLASCYGAGLLVRIASLVALEQDLGLAAFAAEALRECGIHNVAVASGPLNAGWPARARTTPWWSKAPSKSFPPCCRIS
jgi:protein-L-isoaspartate(D-aspartate) O-methyltransferase